LTTECARDWQHAPHDPAALQQIADRLGQAARDQRTLTYGALVRDIEFRVPRISGGQPYRPALGDGAVVRAVDLGLVDEFLTYLSLHSYRGGNIIASALVMAPGRAQPNTEFLRLARHFRGRSPKLFPDHDVWQRELQGIFSYFENLKVSAP